ncbi:Protein of unknown function [Gryllus bimaculatus]|nr:Protein of unknown function [Gryllus bimaculatus]
MMWKGRMIALKICHHIAITLTKVSKQNKEFSAYTPRKAKLLKENRKLKRKLFSINSRLADILQDIKRKQFDTL